MRIGLIMQGGEDWMGGVEYIRNLAMALRASREQMPGERQVYLFHSRVDQTVPEDVAMSVDRVIPLDAPAAGAPSWWSRLKARFGADERAVRNRHVADQIRQVGVDVLYPITYANRSFSLPLKDSLVGIRWLGWIPDFQHKHLPHLFSPREIGQRERGIRLLAEDAREIVFSSAAAAGDFADSYPGARCQTPILRFATQPAPAWFEPDPRAVQERYRLPERYFLVSNQLWQHKNHGVVVKALEQLAARGVFPAVVWTGHPIDARNPGFLSELLQQIHCSGVARQISVLGLIPRVDQIQLMRRAIAVIQPSLFEGWSTVVEDARALGRPVILSDIAVHREQQPPKARFFPPESAAMLADAIEAVWSENSNPGPDHSSEAEARSQAQEALLRYGESFWKLAGG